MASHGVNLQDGFLNHVRKENIEVEVTLSSGMQLRGLVRGFDNFTIVLHLEGKQHLLYKHSISQIVAPKFQRSAARSSDKKSHPSRKSTSRHSEKEKFNAIDLSSVKLELEHAAKAAVSSNISGKSETSATSESSSATSKPEELPTEHPALKENI